MKIFTRIMLMMCSAVSAVMWAGWFFITLFELPYAKSALFKVGKVLNIPILRQPAMWVLFLLICGLGFLFSLYVFLVGLNGDREFKSVVKENSIGFIRISSTTFANISLNVIRKLGGIKDARAIIKLNNDEVNVIIHATFMSDVNIPVISEEAQQRIVRSIEQCTGVKTPSVKIIVDGVQNAYKGRVE